MIVIADNTKNDHSDQCQGVSRECRNYDSTQVLWKLDSPQSDYREKDESTVRQQNHYNKNQDHSRQNDMWWQRKGLTENRYQTPHNGVHLTMWENTLDLVAWTNESENENAR